LKNNIGDANASLFEEQMREVLDVVGKASARAQGLKVRIMDGMMIVPLTYGLLSN
jgi:hypothetical protein